MGSAPGSDPAALNEFLETVTAHDLAKGRFQVAVSFDEFNLDVDIRYAGKLMQFPSMRPSAANLIDDEAALARLSGFLMRQYCGSPQSGRSR